ncbi:MAG: histidine kinase [Cyclobacteriaceae bacterium]|nr:histidine kinase [Cyclobacteriaceae bacterium]
MKQLLFFLFFFHIVFIGHTQRYNFKEYNVTDGLIHSTVTTITEDKRGYLWMGTYDGGISQFDGNTFINFSEGENFAGYYIHDIETGNDGTIWIASNAGLANYNGEAFISYTNSSGLITNKVRSLLFTSDDNFWIGTAEGINLMKNDSIYEFEYNHLFSKRSIRSLIETKDRSIYIGTWDGLFVYKNNKIDSIKTIHNNSLGIIHCLKEDSKGNIWIGTHEGIIKYDGSKITKYKVGEGDVNTIIKAIEEDKEGNLWFATLGQGAFLYNGEKFISISNKNGLSTNGLFSLYKDAKDNLWIGGGGLNKYFGKGFSHLGKNEGLVHDAVFQIVEDVNGNMWIGTESGISYYNSVTGEINNYTEDNGLTGNTITSIIETKKGEIWVATLSGLNKFEKGKFIQHPKYIGMELWSLLEDKDGNIWIGMNHGIVKEERINKTLIEPINHMPILNNTQESIEISEFLKNSSSSVYYSGDNGFADVVSYVSSLDDDGNIWIGTNYNGLYKYSNEQFESFTIDKGLNSNTISQVVPDGKGGMWIGTDKGISHYHKGKIRNYGIKDGLWMEVIYNLVVDGENIWIGGTKGIQKLVFDENKNIIDNYKFDQYEGFTSIETNDKGGMKDSKGNLWFGTIKGATIVKPDAINYQTSPTTSHITDIKLFFEDVDWSNYSDSLTSWYKLPTSLILPYDKNQLTFNFVGINLKAPEKIRYKWKLEGFDNSWAPETNKMEANYTNLPPGEYTFLVMASNEKGAWNPNYSTFSFQINYPIYLRWWFITLAILVCITSIWSFILFRIKHLHKKAANQQLLLESERKMVESERKALRAQINPHFIFNVLNSIQYYIQNNESLIASRHLSKFSKLMRMILDNSKSSTVPLADEIEALELYMDLENLRSDNKFKYEIKISNSIDISDCRIPPMLIQPFIENSIRHGIIPSDKKGLITIRLSQKENIISCAIEDSGIGIKASLKNKTDEDTHISKGMAITSDRLKIINDQLRNDVSIEIIDLSEFDSKKTGTRINIYIPIE